MAQQRSYDPLLKCGKIKLEPIEWEKLPILNTSVEEHSEQPKKQRTKRRSKYQLDRERLLEEFDGLYSGVRWNLFGTLGFYPRNLELWRKKWAFDKWIDEETADDTDHHRRWVRVIEHSDSGNSCRFHIFLKSSLCTSKYILMARWTYLVGVESDLWYVTSAAAPKRYLEDVVLGTSYFEIKEFND